MIACHYITFKPPDENPKIWKKLGTSALNRSKYCRVAVNQFATLLENYMLFWKELLERFVNLMCEEQYRLNQYIETII